MNAFAPDISPSEIARYRSDTPATEDLVHLNNAGAGLMPSAVVDAIHGHIDLEARIGGYEAAEAVAADMAEVYSDVAALVKAAPSNIALMEHATAAYNSALSAVDFKQGDVLVTTNHDYVSNQIAFLALERRCGIEVVRVPDTPDGAVDLAEMKAVIQRRLPKLVAVTHVPTNSGLVQPVAEIGALCATREVLYLVDACQSVGQMPVDVNEVACDFLSSTGRKFIRGPRGTGFLYVSDRALALGLEPMFPDLHGATWIDDNLYQIAPDATRFETWESSVACRLGLGAAARYATTVGIEAIRSRVFGLADQLRELLGSVPGARVLDKGAIRCGIVTVAVDGVPSIQLSNAMRERSVNTSYVEASSAVIDFREKDVDAAVRLSPHYYNTTDELQEAVEVMTDLVQSGGWR